MNELQWPLGRACLGLPFSLSKRSFSSSWRRNRSRSLCITIPNPGVSHLRNQHQLRDFNSHLTNCEPGVKFPPFISYKLSSLVDKLLQNLSAVAHVDSQGTWKSSANVTKASLVQTARLIPSPPISNTHDWSPIQWIDHYRSNTKPK